MRGAVLYGLSLNRDISSVSLVANPPVDIRMARFSYGVSLVIGVDFGTTFSAVAWVGLLSLFSATRVTTLPSSFGHLSSYPYRTFRTDQVLPFRSVTLGLPRKSKPFGGLVLSEIPTKLVCFGKYH